MTELIKRRDIDFLLYEFLNVEQLLEHPRYADHDRKVFDAIIDTAVKIAEEKFQTCAKDLDNNEPSFDGQKVTLIPQVKEALRAFAEAGFPAATYANEQDGLQLPWTVFQAAMAYFHAANISLSAYPLLTGAAANLLNAHGSVEQKALYLPHMLSGRFFGTMCLSETQAGSSLSDIRTRAEPTDQGYYLIKGTKMWISGGEHDLAENIIHMVLAKIPGGPPGVKGISLFIVPKIHVLPDGSLGERNDVALAGLNHKMGYRGTVNTVMSFGEKDNCKGYLIGEPHKGLECMFHMMNEARIGIGMGATTIGYAGYLYSLDYARQRPQGRHPLNKNPQSPQVPIIEHADIRRLLLTQKSYVEGALALQLYCAMLVDEQKISADTNRKQVLALLLDILTPIAKSWPSEFCLEANKLAMQILGGYGYTREYPLERLYRDNRLNPIHEGTHGIHGIDLLGRKVRMAGGKAFTTLLDHIRETIREASGNRTLQAYAGQLSNTLQEVEKTTAVLIACENLNLSLANSTIYLDMLGHVVIAWTWLRQAIVVAANAGNATGDDKDFYQGKLAACRYFFHYELPKTHGMMQLLQSLDDTCLNITSSQL
jgi:butyryl-CoA dehydrogenase